jgi:hypothetical protein
MKKNINKLSDNGRVAVLYSPGFGAGWSTWNQEVPEIIFDPAIVKFVEKDQWAKLETYVTLKCPGLYMGGMKDLKIEWVPEGSLFRINEYDGSESIELQQDVGWIVA